MHSRTFSSWGKVERKWMRGSLWSSKVRTVLGSDWSILAPLRSIHVTLLPDASKRHLSLYQHQEPCPTPWIRTKWWWWWGFAATSWPSGFIAMDPASLLNWREVAPFFLFNKPARPGTFFFNLLHKLQIYKLVICKSDGLLQIIQLETEPRFR